MPKIHFERFDNLLKFLPKSKIKAGDGQDSGKYPFFKSGNDQSKFIDTAIFEGESLIIGDGGNANINFYDKKFSASDHCYVIQKNSQNIDVKYVYYYLKSNLQILEAGFKGAGLKNISKKYISEIKIPLLALQDQQKIAQQLSQIEELINKREESIKLLDELTKSTFLDMFISIKDKKLFPLGDYIDFMTSGSRGWAQYYSETGAIFLRIQNVNNGKLLLDDIIRVNLPNKTEGTRTRVQENDLLMSITADLGRTAVIPKDFEEAYINQHLALLRLKLDLISPIYLSHYFCTDFAKLQVQKYNKGGAKAGLNFTDIKKINILIPSKPLQDKFVEIVTQIEQTKIFYQNSLTELNNLFGSIAQKAFRGENVKKKIEKMKTYKSVEDRLKSVEKECISKMDNIMGNKSATELTKDDERKAVALRLGYKFGFYDDESIKVIDDFLYSEEFLIGDKDENELINKILEVHPQPNVFASIIKDDQSKNDEVKIIKNIVNKHFDKNILINPLINLIFAKEQNLRVRYASSELIADYDNLSEEIREIIEIIYNEEKIEEEVRLHTAYAFTDKINIYPELHEAIYWILRKQSTSLLSNKEVFIHFLGKEFEEKKGSLAFDTLVKNIAYDSRRMTAYKMFLFDLLKYDIDSEPLNNYDYKALKDDIFRLIKEKKIIQKLNPSTYEINLFWNFSELEEK